VVRGPDLTASMSQYLIDEIERRPNIDVLPHTQIREAHGAGELEGLTLWNSQTDECRKVPARALFVFIGAQPRTDWLEGTIERDKHGFVLAGRDLMRGGNRPEGWTPPRDPFLLETGIPGVFVAGDVRSGSMKRVASSVGEGSIAVSFVHQHLANVR
jgi:thioredoxin reductase (NADPH)